MKHHSESYPRIPLRYVIRADARFSSGAGHFMRAAVLAEELIARNEKVVFIGDISQIPWVSKYAKSFGFDQMLSEAYEFTSNPETDILILDSYEIDPDDNFLSEDKWRFILTFVDDVSPPYKSRIYVNAGCGNTWETPINCQESLMLSGVDYIPIRKEIRELALRNKSKIESIKILITGGGSDPFGFCAEVCKILLSFNLDFEARILSPRFSLENLDKRFEFVELNGEISQILDDINIVISTAGTSSWDFLFLQVEVALACAVSNQTNNYKFMVGNNLATGIGKRSDDGIWEFIPELLFELLSRPKHVEKIYENVRLIPDGLAASRIINCMKIVNAQI